MTKEQLDGLIKLGYTADQIIAINAAAKAAKPDQTPAPITNPDPTPAPTPTPNPAPEAPAESETVKLIKEMMGMMRNGMINGLSGQAAPEKSASDILADIIDPE